MFLETNGFKRLIKEAWKRSCLFLSRQGDLLMICSGYWFLINDIEMIPNKIKGAIIELTGELPGDGVSFQSGKGGNQYEITQTLPWEFMGSDHLTSEPAEETQVILEENGTLLRIIKSKRDAFLVQKQFSDLITVSDIMEGREAPPEGPFVDRENREENIVKRIWWTNGTGIFLVYEFQDRAEWQKDLLDYCTREEVGIKK